jgi:hypothetical protein
MRSGPEKLGPSGDTGKERAARSSLACAPPMPTNWYEAPSRARYPERFDGRRAPRAAGARA